MAPQKHLQGSRNPTGHDLKFLLYAAYSFGFSGFSFKNVVFFVFYFIIKLFEY